MLFFDYLYYLFSSLSRLSKQERILEGWRISGSALTSLSLTLFSLIIIERVDHYWGTDLFNELIGILLLLLYLLFFGIRYTKFVSYEKVTIRLKVLSPTKQVMLNISLITYLLIIIVSFIYAIFLKEHLNKGVF